MAATVASYTGDLHATLSIGSNPPPPRPASAENTWLPMEIEALAGLWTHFHHGNSKEIKSQRDVHNRARRFHGIKDERFLQRQTYTSRTLDLLPPPSYDESVADLPPDYTGTGALAVAQSLVDVKLGPGLENAQSRDSKRRSDDKVDLTQPQGVRYHANKKAKKAQKAAQKDKWADDDGEKKEEAPPPDDGAGGGGDAPAGGDGAGGDPPGDGGDGNGEDPDDIWGAVGGKKNKKKKKKNAW